MIAAVFRTSIFAALAMLLCQPATAQIVQTRADALAQDAAEYARIYAVSQDEAVRRLRAQHDSVATTDAIARRYRDRLAGISVQHRPDYRYIVYLTGTDLVPETFVRSGGTRVPVVFRTGAAASRDRVIWALTNHQAAIRAAFPSPPSMGIDPRTGELVVMVGRTIAAADGGAPAVEARLEAMTGVPVTVRVIERTDVNLGLSGGALIAGTSPSDGKRYRCTTGFAVTDGVRDAITTAAHCLDDMTYYDAQRRPTSLGFVGQWGWGYHDVQIHTGPVVGRAVFHPDAARATLRPVELQRAKASTRAGDFVCHRGESSGYSCGEVELVDFAPAGELCGGACVPTWIAVGGATCRAGDSGGPVFVGTTAYGVVKGGSYRRDGSCALYYYMSLDYLPSPWRLMIDGARRSAPPTPAVEALRPTP